MPSDRTRRNFATCNFCEKNCLEAARRVDFDNDLTSLPGFSEAKGSLKPSLRNLAEDQLPLERDDLRQCMELSQVCTLWRKAALGFPLMWTRVHLGSRHALRV